MTIKTKEEGIALKKKLIVSLKSMPGISIVGIEEEEIKNLFSAITSPLNVDVILYYGVVPGRKDLVYLLNFAKKPLFAFNSKISMKNVSIVDIIFLISKDIFGKIMLPSLKNKVFFLKDNVYN
jgi:hypothetical protein